MPLPLPSPTKLLTTTTLITILGIGGIITVGNNFIKDTLSLFSLSNTTPEIDIRPLILAQINEISELTTAELVMETIVPTSAETKIGNFSIGKTKLLYIAQGEVTAGIDLSNLTTDHIRLVDNKLEIQLPPPEILDRKIDVERSGVYEYNRGFLNLGPDVAPELQSLAERQTLQRMVVSACDQGLLEIANQKAQETIAQLFTHAGYTEVEVKTTPPLPESCPSSVSRR